MKTLIKGVALMAIMAGIAGALVLALNPQPTALCINIASSLTLGGC